jgi:transketolase
MVGGSADLTGSNNTRTKGMTAYSATNPAGRYVHWGVREHGMAAAMNGMALHGGVIPYAGTFLVFADYARPAIRLAALMGVRVIHVMTHDSIGLGEDGPTHQPVEHLASLRAMPNCTVFRPCDAIEAAECWELALGNASGPSIMALSRQKVAFVRTDGSPTNRCASGGYVISPAAAPERAVIIATGTEVEIALMAQADLATKGIGARVVSMPCHELFAAQSAAYQSEVLGEDLPRVSIEAGSTYGWSRWVGPSGVSIGIDTFGASAPYQDLYRHFGITAEAVVSAVESLI